MDRLIDAARPDPVSTAKRINVENSLLVRLAELQLENERLREDNMQLRAALSMFSEVAKRSLQS